MGGEVPGQGASTAKIQSKSEVMWERGEMHDIALRMYWKMMVLPLLEYVVEYCLGEIGRLAAKMV